MGEASFTSKNDTAYIVDMKNIDSVNIRIWNKRDCKFRT